METGIYENRAKELITEIRQLIEVKGLNLDDAMTNAGISKETVEGILDKGTLPSLTEFLALCEISGITIHLPSVETPNTSM